MMKIKLFILFIIFFNFCFIFSQVPQGFKYQAIARDGSENILQNTPLQVMFYVQSQSTGGTLYWKEWHSSVTTNNFGLFNLVVGNGVRQTESTFATFDAIDWSVTSKYLKTEIYYDGSWKDMGTSQLLSVPYAMVAEDLAGSVKKLTVEGETASFEDALFEVKNKNGQTIFAVYNEGVRIYVDNGAKGPKGGFAVGGFGTDKAESQKYLVVTKDSTRVYVDNNPSTKKMKGGFAVGGYDMTKGTIQNYLDVSDDSIRMYIDSDPSTKKLKGGFAVGGYDLTKGTTQDYLNVNSDSVRIYIDSDNTTKKLKGGFAVGGFDLTKESIDEYIRVTADSVKVSKSLLIPRLTTEERDNLPFTPGEALIIFNMSESCMQIFKNNVWSNIWCFNCAPDFIIQPVDKTICSGENAVFFVSATGTSLSYKWQQSTDGGSSWNIITNGGSNPAFSGANGSTLTLSNVPVAYNSHEYRCVVAGSCLPEVTSNAVTLNVGSSPPVITSQPTDQQLSTECAVNFSIASPGYGVTYKWQQSSDGGSNWTNIADGGTSPVFEGATTSTLSLSNVALAYNNYKFLCIVSNSCGTDASSNAATLTMNTSPAITVQPVDKLVYVNQNITFNITTSGTGFSYQWQESTNGGGTWLNVNNGGSNPSYAGANTADLTLSNVPLANNNYKYRCVVSNFCRPDATSDVASLSVPTSGPVTDIDGNIYNTVGIGSQLWMAENLKTTRYKDGTTIPLVTDGTAWSNLTTPGYCWHNNDEATYKATYGALYNWYTVNTNNLCPSGWHVPTNAEWITLENYLITSGFNYDGTTIGNKYAKALASTNLWISSTITGAVGNIDYPAKRNATGFTALPSGSRYTNGIFNSASIGYNCFWWSATVYNATIAGQSSLSYNKSNVIIGSNGMTHGYSVRCIKD